MSPVPASILRRTVGALVTLLLLLGISPTVEGSCGWTPDKTPSRAADPDLWNGLEPTEVDGLPSDRDTTFFDLNGSFSHTRPLWKSLDAEGGFIFAGYNLGLHVFNAQGANAASPAKAGTFQVESLPILFRNPHDYFLVTDVDLPDGENHLAVMTGWDAIGMAVFDTSNKSKPRLIYQDGGTSGTKYGQGVYATKINGKYYGFLAAQRPGVSNHAGIWMYDLTRAQEVGATVACSETLPAANPACAGVFVRKLSSDNMSHVDGSGNFVVFSGGSGGPTGLEIWNVGNPSSPTQRLTGLSDRRVDGVAMWEQGANVYLAATLRRDKTHVDEARIYDVSCIKTTCAGNPLNGAPLYDFPTPGGGLSARMSASVSHNNGSPYLYVGRANSYVNEGLQAEWLLDVSNPASPAEVAGGDPRNGNLGQPTITFEGQQVGYWSWYYACHPSGSNSFEPADGRLMNGYFYRAGSSILDVHKLKDVTPRIQVTAATASTYQDTPVGMTAQAFNCTPNPSGWSWNGGDGTVTGSGAAVSISWATVGSKTVSAGNSACGGATVTPASVQVATAAPAVVSVSSDVASALICSPVTFTANSVTGKPTLGHQWEILDAGNAVVTTLASNATTATWDTASAPGAGDYRARYTVSNDAGSATKTSAAVTLSSPGTPGFTAAIAATVNFGDVTFAANSTGATEWHWTFGDGDELTTTDPLLGPNPTHRYDAVGTYDVTVEVRNCQNTTWVEQQTQVTIVELNPLDIVQFQAKKNFGFFIYSTGESISFTEAGGGSTHVEGDPDFYDYDWNGDGTFEDANRTTPAASHAYAAPGEYQPRLRVRRGAAEETMQHAQVLNVIPGAPASISVSGPSSGKVNASVSFLATWSNCNPTTWSWTASGGGNVSGSGSSVSVSWSSTGSKTVTASNAACGTASGSRSISISDDTQPPPTGLKAAFSVGPVVAEIGQTISFDASASTGSPTVYTWDFGDGETGSGKQATHAYQAAGSYTVELEIAKAGTGAGCFSGFCTATLSKQVEIAAPEDPVGANGCTGDLKDDDSTLCLMDGRYELKVDWLDHHNGGKTGVGTGRRYADSEITGFFWFFNPNSVDLIVKVLNGGPVNGKIWVFYGSLSDVRFELEVTDNETGLTKVYENLEGTICGRADTGAFPLTVAGGAQGGLTSGTAGFRPGYEDEEEEEEDSEEGEDDGGTGSSAEPTDLLSLLSDRYQVSVEWKNQHNGGDTGVGYAVPGTNQVGYFWFFKEENLELVVKMVDARSITGYNWMFWGSLSDVEYTIKVVDTQTGNEWTRTNPPGSFCGGADTRAFED